MSLILNNTKVNKQITWTFQLKAANLFIEKIIQHLNFVFVIMYYISVGFLLSVPRRYELLLRIWAW